MPKSLILFIMLLLTSLNIYATGQPYGADDILAFTRIDYVAVSPDGKQIAYVTVNRDKNKWRYALNLKEPNGNITEITHAENISSVSWSPDGSAIAFISPNDKDQQVISIYHLAEKKLSPLITLSKGIVGLHWSPSGKQIAFIAEDDKHTPQSNGLKTLPEPGTNLRLYVTDLNAGIQSLTPADFSMTYDPMTRGFSWAPDGNEIAFAYQPGSKPIDDIQPKVAIVNLTTKKIAPLAYCKTRTCRQPIFSPDGKWLAFTTNIPATGKAKALLEDIEIRNKVCLRNSNDQTHCLQDTFDKNPWLLAFNAEGNAIYALEHYKSQGIKIYKISENPNTPVELFSTQKDFIEPLTLSLNATHTVFGFALEGVNQAPEVYTSPADHLNLQQETHFNQKYNKLFGSIHVLNWKSKDGTPVEGLFITPQNYDPEHAYPLYVDVHGGPSGSKAIRYLGGCDEYGEGFVPTECPANILSLGYVILQVNFRGTSGYGSDFRVKNFADLGDGDFQDIMSGIDYVTKHYSIDKNKMVIAGWSYGGYLTAGAITHTNRFALAIDGDGMTDYLSFAGTTDDTDFGYRYLGVNSWENPPLYWKHSPIAYVKNIQTPLLIIHGEQDIRVPITQAKELFTALTLLNKPVKMIIAPKQSHVPSDPETFEKEMAVIDQVLMSRNLQSY
ncbi:MAG TPA: S9 family peptidase [Gammaproteobacteria bacterium]|nr:S9 family peptidase [Gammaproteobacteria bacterium]